MEFTNKIKISNNVLKLLAVLISRTSPTGWQKKQLTKENILMKKIQISVLALALAISMASCSKNEVNADSATVLTSDNASTGKGNGGNKGGGGTTIAVSSLPEAITTYISTNYAGYTTSSARIKTSGNYDVTVVATDGTPTMLTFTSAGVFVSANAGKTKGTNTSTSISVSSLPEAITTYISTNYAGSTIQSAHIESSNSYYDVTILSTTNVSTKLYFDATGAFVSANTKTRGGTKTETAIDITTLSSTITSYISTNYAGSTIVSAHSESNGNIDVVFTTAAGVSTRATFTSAGDFVSVDTVSRKAGGVNSGTTIDIATLPSEVTSYISTTYPGSTLVSAHTETNGNYDVTITTSASKTVKLYFTSAGVFISTH